MWDFGLMLCAAGLRVIHALLSGHATPALALTSSLAQMAWLQLRGGGAAPSRWWTASQIVRIGLCGVVFAILPPGSRLVVSLLDRAARSAACSRFCARMCALKLADLAPTSRLAF
jgi:hypothetical protein